MQLFNAVCKEVTPMAPATFDERVVNVHQASSSLSTADQYGAVVFLCCFPVYPCRKCVTAKHRMVEYRSLQQGIAIRLNGVGLVPQETDRRPCVHDEVVIVKSAMAAIAPQFRLRQSTQRRQPFPLLQHRALHFLSKVCILDKSTVFEFRSVPNGYQ